MNACSSRLHLNDEEKEREIARLLLPCSRTDKACGDQEMDGGCGGGESNTRIRDEGARPWSLVQSACTDRQSDRNSIICPWNGSARRERDVFVRGVDETLEGGKRG